MLNVCPMASGTNPRFGRPPWASVASEPTRQRRARPILAQQARRPRGSCDSAQ